MAASCQTPAVKSVVKNRSACFSMGVRYFADRRLLCARNATSLLIRQRTLTWIS
jgi:hypothetical protein